MSLHPEALLFASPHLVFARQDDGGLAVETPDARLVYSARDADDVASWLLSFSTPSRTASLAAADRPGGWARFKVLMAPAAEAGAFSDVSDFVSATSTETQLSAYFELCDRWAKDVFAGRFWTKVLGGDASTALMLGWCEQFYHRTVGADEHNAVAVENCDLPGVKEELIAHFSEEVGHGEIFLRGLEAAGVSRQAVAARPALLSTRALIMFFSDLGRTDTLAYLACYGVLHSPREGQTLEAVQQQFSALAAAYPEAGPAIRKVGDHAELDVRAGHDQIVFERYLRGRAPLTHGEALRALSSVRNTVMTFNAFFEGILEAYA